MTSPTVLRLSLLALSLTLTLAMDSWVGAPLFQRSERSAISSRHPRDTYHHFPCVFLSQLSDIKHRFLSWLDHNDDGRATFQEVKAFLQRMKPDVSDDTVRAFIKRRDTDNSGSIELVPEYVKDYIEGDYGPEAAAEWFHLHDVNEDGQVSKSEITHLGQIVAGLSPEQAEQTALGYYLPMDQNGDGQLNYQEFSTLYQPPPPMPSYN